MASVLPFVKMSTGFPSHGQPLNCQLGPMTKTPTTRSQSALVKFLVLSTILYGTVTEPSFRRCTSISFSRLAPLFFFSSVVTNLHIKVSIINSTLRRTFASFYVRFS